MLAFAGQLALVTGASRGIGAETAVALAAHGAHVVLTARTAGGLEAVEQRIHEAGGTATIAPLDLTDGESIGRLATALAERWSALDMLILNAAMLGSLAPVVHLDPKEFAQVLTLNISAQAALLAAFDPMLRASKAARIVGVTSSVGQSPKAYWGAYGASKAGFEALLAAHVEETRGLGRVRVAIVDPGATRTAMRARAFPGEDPASVKSPAVVAAAIAGLLTSDFTTGHRVRVN